MGWRRGRTYGQGLHDWVLAADRPVREVARRFAVGESYVARARQQRGQVSAGVQCNYVFLRLQRLERALTGRVAAAPEQTLTQLCQWGEAEHDVRVSPTALWKTLGRLGLTLKKIAPGRRAATCRCSSGTTRLGRRAVQT
ncbi:hypothetical protein [Azorhizophilus paspali]|uniref:hypothetical protein n=1 Tax=Azorhizophilus paspali TaxID=69963 RepID=UPI003639D848